MKKKLSSSQKRLLGMDLNITRRDFLNAALLGTGALLLEMPAPIHVLAQNSIWGGYGGTGDYAQSHGNTAEVMTIYNAIQKGKYKRGIEAVLDTDEMFDLVVIGGGLSGLGAAYEFKKHARKGQTCLILENHPVFGGQAKRNEFSVNGHRLIGPQASNAFVVIDRPGIPGYEIFSELDIPHAFQYQSLDKDLRQLQFDRTNYGFALWHDISPNVGYFFENNDNGNNRWVRDIWSRKLEGTAFSEESRRDLMVWRNGKKKYYGGSNRKKWLDSMTYKDYLEKVMALSPDVTRFADPILASGLGLGCDAISAYGAYQISMPGFQGFTGRERERRLEESTWHSFPGGNDGFVRYLIKALIPDALSGGKRFEDIISGRIHFSALDRADNAIRIRLGSMAVDVNHNVAPKKSEHVLITYVRSGKAYRVRARSVIMASGSWINRHVASDLPSAYHEAFGDFLYSSVMVINVALTNWRFLYKLNLTGCRWFKGFGYTCNIRTPMIVGGMTSPLHPDKPIVLTFYVPFHYPGLPIKEQGLKGQAEILSTGFNAYEQQIREQMVRLFSAAGFDPRRDIAGIILNRWVYAYLNPQPGFYFGMNGKTASRDVIRRRFGRIAFGHSELDGHQNWSGAITEGRRAYNQIAEIL